MFCLPGGAALGTGTFFCTPEGVFFCPTLRITFAGSDGVRAESTALTGGDKLLDDRLATVFLVMASKTKGQTSGARLFFQ